MEHQPDKARDHAAWREASEERKRRTRRFRWRVRLGVLFGLLIVLALGGWFMFSMPGRSHSGPLPTITPHQTALRDALRADLVHLASDIGSRNVSQPERLDAAEAFLTTSLEEAGYTVRRQPYVVSGREVANLDVEIPGSSAASEIVVVGAHYDTVPGCPGANDNGTGVVGTLALARAFAGTAPRRTLRFACFVNEEPPYFQTHEMGSLVYALACEERGDDIVGMVCLETIGCYLDGEGTQRYPFPIGLLYPDEGNFIAFVSNLGSRGLVRDVVGSFRAHAAFPSEGSAVPSWVQGVGWSDHWSFWQAGYPAVMVTDTALFRYDAYHTSRDTVDVVTFDRFARVVDGLTHVVADLAGVTLPPDAFGE